MDHVARRRVTIVSVTTRENAVVNTDTVEAAQHIVVRSASPCMVNATRLATLIAVMEQRVV
jgi:hypothetical protein